jgi:ubiquinone/menaquinone biosynthesis C-methylase UbiE
MEAGRCSRIIVRRQKNNVADMIMTKSDWDYRGLAAECYDLWFGDEPFWDQAFFHDRIRRNGGTALEIACGTGRLLVPFLRDGLAVHGMDASEEMLAICRTKAAHVGLTPTLYHQLMQDLDLAEYNHTVFIPACSFQIPAERGEAFAALRRFHKHLDPDGELLITLTVPWRDFGLERQWRLRRSGVRPSDGATILIHEATISDRVEQVQHIWMRHEVFKEGHLIQTQLRTHRMRWYHRHEFAMMLESVGFREVAMQCGYNDNDRTKPEAEWIFIAKQ